MAPLHRSPTRGRPRLRVRGALAFGALLAWAPIAAAQDVTGPSLVDCSVTPSPIDATTGPGTGTWTVRLSDDLSGVESAAALFIDPGFATVLAASVDASHRSSGDDLDGVYTVAFEVPEFSPSGAWSVFALSVNDVAGNTTSVPVASLPPSCGFDVVSLPDVAPPTLSALSVSPGTADVTLGPAPLDLTTVLGDDRSGVDHAAITFESPSGAENVVVDVTSGDLVAGDALSGTYAVTFEMPQLAESGVWQVSSVRIVDGYGYVTELDAASLGLPSPPTVDVSSTPDSTPPQLVWLAAVPEVVHLGSSPPTVELRVRIRDDVTGLGVNGILLESPVEGVVAGLAFDEADRITGDALDGVYAASIELAPDAPTGAWGMTVSLADAAGNSVQLTGGQIAGPSQVLVVAGAPPPPAVPMSGAITAFAVVTSLMATGVRRLGR